MQSMLEYTSELECSTATRRRTHVWTCEWASTLHGAFTFQEICAVCSTQPRNLHNLEIVLSIFRIWKLRASLEIVQSILRLHNMFTQSQDCVSTIHKHNRLMG